MKIAKRQPFTGKPVIHTPSVFGASTAKSFMYRIPVTGERPITVEMVSENEHIRLENGIFATYSEWKPRPGNFHFPY